MPQTTDERRARWPGTDSEAIEFLIEQGFRLTTDWCWIPPRPELTEREQDAVTYLEEEWDYGHVRWGR